MRLAVCTMSALLLSGCSWFGGASNHHGSYGHNAGGYGMAGSAYGGGSGCYNVDNSAYGGYATQSVDYTAAGIQCAPGAGGMMQAGYGGAGFSGESYASANGMTAGYGAGNASYGSAAYGGAGYNSAGYGSAGVGGATTLGASAPYGAATAGYAGGSVGGGNVMTVQGAPIYVDGTGGAYGGAAGYGSAAGYGGAYGPGCCGGSGSLPLGLELGIGGEAFVGGDIFPGEVAKPFLGGPGTVSELDPISYGDAFKTGLNYELAASYDVNPNTTIFGQIGYHKAEGQEIEVGTVDDGAGVSETLNAEFSDLEQIRLEGGLRKYVGGPANHGARLRPYVGASAGFTKTDDVILTQSSATLVDPTLFQQTYIDGGWKPTAAGIIGAEFATGPRTAIGIESGIRWTDNLDTNIASDDTWSIPVKLRGRIAF